MAKNQTLRSFIREVLSVPPTRSITDILSGWSDYLDAPDFDDYDSPDLDAVSPASMSSSSYMTRPGGVTALIVGDSQAGGLLGSTLQTKLEGMGLNVTRNHEDGAGGGRVLAQFPPEGSMPDIVIAIFGGNDSSPDSAVSAARTMLKMTQASGSHLVIVGPPPPTKILNTRSAGKVFSQLGPEPSPDAWLTKDGGEYARKRVSISDQLESSLASQRGVSVYGIASHWAPEGLDPKELDYPDQPDGLHIVNGAREIVDEIVSELDIPGVIEDVKAAKGESSANMPFDYDRWIKEISRIEGNYQSVNPDSVALGKYQFVPAFWWDEIKAFAGPRIYDNHEIVSYTRRDKPFYKDYQNFLDDPQLQEDWMRHYTLNYAVPAAESLRREFPEKTSRRSIGQLAALYHFQGLGGARSWLSRGEMQGADVNAINPDQYMDRVT